MKLVNRRNAGAAIAATGILLGVSGLAISPAAGAPKGEGTVHIAGVDETPGNDPHVDCEFTVEFLGFPEGATADLTFTAQAPTGQQGELLVIEDLLVGAVPEPTLDVSFDDFDASQFTSTHQHGYSVKLDVEVGDAPGNAKSKTFWVAAGCADEGTGDEGSGDEGTGDEGTGDEGTGDEGTGDEGTGAGDEGTENEGTEDDQPEVTKPEVTKPEVKPSVTERPVVPAAPAPEVLPNVVAARPQATVAGVTTLPRTGADDLSLAYIGFGLVLMGAAAMLLGRTEAAAA